MFILFKNTFFQSYCCGQHPDNHLALNSNGVSGHLPSVNPAFDVISCSFGLFQFITFYSSRIDMELDWGSPQGTWKASCFFTPTCFFSVPYFSCIHPKFSQISTGFVLLVCCTFGFTHVTRLHVVLPICWTRFIMALKLAKSGGWMSGRFILSRTASAAMTGPWTGCDLIKLYGDSQRMTFPAWVPGKGPNLR